jgi:hypothetical protein
MWRGWPSNCASWAHSLQPPAFPSPTRETPRCTAACPLHSSPQARPAHGAEHAQALVLELDALARGCGRGPRPACGHVGGGGADRNNATYRASTLRLSFRLALHALCQWQGQGLWALPEARSRGLLVSGSARVRLAPLPVHQLHELSICIRQSPMGFLWTIGWSSLPLALHAGCGRGLGPTLHRLS